MNPIIMEIIIVGVRLTHIRVGSVEFEIGSKVMVDLVFMHSFSEVDLWLVLSVSLGVVKCTLQRGQVCRTRLEGAGLMDGFCLFAVVEDRV